MGSSPNVDDGGGSAACTSADCELETLRDALREDSISLDELVTVTSAVAAPPSVTLVVQPDNTPLLVFSEPVLALPDGDVPTTAQVKVQLDSSLVLDATLTPLNATTFEIDLGLDGPAAGGEALAVIIDVYSLVGVRGGLMDPTRLGASLVDLRPPQLEKAVLGTPAADRRRRDRGAARARFSEAVVGEAAALARSDGRPVELRPGTLQLLAVEAGRRAAAPRRGRQALVRASCELLQRRRGGGGVGGAAEGKVFDEAGNAATTRAVLARARSCRRHIAGEG